MKRWIDIRIESPENFSFSLIENVHAALKEHIKLLKENIDADSYDEEFNFVGSTGEQVFDNGFKLTWVTGDTIKTKLKTRIKTIIIDFFLDRIISIKKKHKLRLRNKFYGSDPLDKPKKHHLKKNSG